MKVMLRGTDQLFHLWLSFFREHLGAIFSLCVLIPSALYMNWQITSDLTLALRYGIFFPSSDAFGANDDPRHFFYGGLTFAF